jgi:RHS repeat-associated protein
VKKLLFIFLIFPFLVRAENLTIDLGKLGKIVYYFEEGLCEKVARLSAVNEVKYEHLYHYDEDKKLVSESLIYGLGKIEYFSGLEEGYLITKTPFGEEKWTDKDRSSFIESSLHKAYDECGRLIQKGTSQYFYEGDKLTRILSDQKDVIYGYDRDHKKVYKKLITEGVEEVEYYLYLGNKEIGSISADGTVKWLRIPGLQRGTDLVRAIAIETADAIYAPIYDHRWNIVKLVNVEDGTVTLTRPDPFGENLNKLSGCPWTFCSKRFDPDTNLVDFGYRYYDIDLKEWTSLDPLMQDTNPYRYCFNNPMQFMDPDGRYGFIIPVLSWAGGAITFPLWGPEFLAFLAGASVAYVGYEICDYCNKMIQKHEDEKAPPYTWDDLGDDPSKCPDEGFEWRGKGEPEDGKGNWIRGRKPDLEQLNPDLDHPYHGPHWDYYGPNFPDGIRIYPDRWEHK